MKKFVLLWVLFAGCGFPPPEGYIRFDQEPENQAMIDYAEQKATEFFGVKPEWYEIWMSDSLERTIKDCGGVACNKFGRIVIHPDTDEYICQQLLHEFGHSATYALGQGWYRDFGPDFNSFMSESCRDK